MAELPGEAQEPSETFHLTSCMASAPTSLCNGHSHALNTLTRYWQGWAAPMAVQKGLVSFWFGSQQGTSKSLFAAGGWAVAMGMSLPSPFS